MKIVIAFRFLQYVQVFIARKGNYTDYRSDFALRDQTSGVKTKCNSNTAWNNPPDEILLVALHLNKHFANSSIQILFIYCHLTLDSDCFHNAAVYWP